MMFMVIAIAYACAVYLSDALYLHNKWGYYGFLFVTPSFQVVSLMTLLVFMVSMMVPLKIDRPSSLLIVTLYLVIYIPTVVITLCLSKEAVKDYGIELSSLTVAFFLICIAARLPLRRYSITPLLPGREFSTPLIAMWLVLGIYLIWRYHAVMHLVGLDSIYGQRALAVIDDGITGYAMSYFAVVVNPALVTIGIIRRRRLLLVMGVLGAIIVYAINATKISLALPLLMLILAKVWQSDKPISRSSVLLSVGMLGIYAFVFFAHYVMNTSVPMDLFAFRSIGLPALTFSQYSDIFSHDGYTWWSHIKGISLFIPAPSAYANDPSWPNLGHIVGGHVYESSEVNANANFFVSDGVASAGSLGILVIGVVAAFLFSTFDRLAKFIDPLFVMLATLPLATIITNGSIFTLFLSFGGFFWMLVFFLYRSSPKNFSRPEYSYARR